MDIAALFDFQVLVVAVFLAVVNMKIVDYVTAPIKLKWPYSEHLWILYFALATGFLISWFGDINLFIKVIADPVPGKVLTGILVGGGASLIYDIMDTDLPGV